MQRAVFISLNVMILIPHVQLDSCWRSFFPHFFFYYFLPSILLFFFLLFRLVFLSFVFSFLPSLPSSCLSLPFPRLPPSPFFFFLSIYFLSSLPVFHFSLQSLTFLCLPFFFLLFLFSSVPSFLSSSFTHFLSSCLSFLSFP